MMPPKMPAEGLGLIPGWLYDELTDHEIATKLGLSDDWAITTIERYVHARGCYSRIQLIMLHIDVMAEQQPDHPHFRAAAMRLACLLPKERQVIGALLRACGEPEVPRLKLAADLSGVSVGFIKKYLLRAQGSDALNTNGPWQALVKLLYLELKYWEWLFVTPLADKG